jgi:pyruvate dehydrogenase E1 component alpha subunit
MSDPAKYRTKEELKEFQEQDPIVILQKLLVEEGLTDEETLKNMDKRIKERCQEAVDFAEGSEEPPMEALYHDVLA